MANRISFAAGNQLRLPNNTAAVECGGDRRRSFNSDEFDNYNQVSKEISQLNSNINTNMHTEER